MNFVQNFASQERIFFAISRIDIKSFQINIYLFFES